jgi:NAD(P)-dependent dehydrogenase (short-subunit alcohol dehydrogenase family)
MFFPSPVKNFHKDTYPAIDPSQPHLSTKGKNVVITGGGSGIGSSFSIAFAKSGATSISILERKESALLEKKAELEKLYPSTKVYNYATDLTDKDLVIRAFEGIKSAVGVVDILIANAGYSPDLTSIESSDFDDWYASIDINLKGNYNLLKAFIPVASKTACVNGVNGAITHLPHVPGYSGYCASKRRSLCHTKDIAYSKAYTVGWARVLDYLHHEHPDFFVLNIHPGVLETAMSDKNPNAHIYGFDTCERNQDLGNDKANPNSGAADTLCELGLL